MSLELSTSDVQGVPRLITDWLESNNYKERTRNIFFAALKHWVRYIYGKDSVCTYIGIRFGADPVKVSRNVEKRLNEIEGGIDRYLRDLGDRDFIEDYKGFIKWTINEGYASLTIRQMANFVKTFFARHDPRCKIDDESWSRIKRTVLPKSTRASTQDDILTKEQLKRVLKYASIHCRAMIFFLLSTGMRINAACQIKMRDIDLYSDPPRVNILEKYTKLEVGGRVMWFSEEARDAIIDWHKHRKGRKKAAGFGEFDEDLVLNYTRKAFSDVWNATLAKADKGQIPAVLARRDNSTKKRVHVYHVHTLRKFFRTNMGFEGSYKGKSGVPDMIVHAWMGHKAYLSEYDRLGLRRMADIYKENLHVVTVHDEDFVRAGVAIKDARIKELEALVTKLKGAPIDEDALAKRLYDKITKMNQKGAPR